ncbi:MAG: cytochrome C' [Burkholderiaceae bacterium]|nr:cytochrome C' [Burkholderiaceae bacterium]
MTHSLLFRLALATAAASVAMPAMADLAMAKKYNCTACHAVDKKLIGPSYKDVAAKYKNNPAEEAKLMAKVKKGGSGVWGAVPMPPNPTVPDADLKSLVDWIMAGAK